MADGTTVLAIGGKEPEIDPGAFTAPGSVVIGDVVMAEGSSLWYNA
ncbi:anhydrase, partial [Streptomyces sp. NRRL F-6602]